MQEDPDRNGLLSFIYRSLIYGAFTKWWGHGSRGREARWKIEKRLSCSLVKLWDALSWHSVLVLGMLSTTNCLGTLRRVVRAVQELEGLPVLLFPVRGGNGPGCCLAVCALQTSRVLLFGFLPKLKLGGCGLGVGCLQEEPKSRNCIWMLLKTERLFASVALVIQAVVLVVDKMSMKMFDITTGALQQLWGEGNLVCGREWPTEMCAAE